MPKGIAESSSRACFRVRCCALGSIVQVAVLGIRTRSAELGIDWEELCRETRASWMSLIELLELSPEELDIERLLLEAAKSHLGVAVGILENGIAGHGGLPWSCQSKYYMRISSATYTPLSIEGGDLFSAYCLYFESMRGRLSPWLDHRDGLVVLNSILVIARNEYQALERRIGESRIEYLPVSASSNELRVAEEVPQCPLCGQLMERDVEGDWLCRQCQRNEAASLP